MRITADVSAIERPISGHSSALFYFSEYLEGIFTFHLLKLGCFNEYKTRDSCGNRTPCLLPARS
jgi:hypothetical protein